MKPAPRSRARALRIATAAAVVLLTVTSLACAGRHGAHHRRHGFTGDTDTVQIVTTQVGGKNVFIPSTIVVRSGEPVTLSIFNTTDAPHGFWIPALDVTHVVPVQQEYAIELPPLQGHQVLQIRCQLHTAHRTATLVVVPGRQ